MRLANAVSNADARRILGAVPASKEKGNKFNAVKVVNELGSFDSKHEAQWAGNLSQARDCGFITALTFNKLELKYVLDVQGVRVGDYTADAKFDVVHEFVVMTLNGPVTLKPGQHYVCDAKSPPTRKKADYQLRKKLVFALHRIEILEL